MLGMDIALGEGWLKIYSSTYILNLCQRWLEYPIEEYDHVSTPSQCACRGRHIPGAACAAHSGQEGRRYQLLTRVRCAPLSGGVRRYGTVTPHSK